VRRACTVIVYGLIIKATKALCHVGILVILHGEAIVLVISAALSRAPLEEIFGVEKDLDTIAPVCYKYEKKLERKLFYKYG